MIPKAHIVQFAEEDGLFPTTVDKDYVLGWLLYGVAQHPVLSRWIFKGGTCLKKCFFETYRFSEDLDFTVPAGEPLSQDGIEAALEDVCEWVANECGISFPTGGLKVDKYSNKQGSLSYQAKLRYSGPYPMRRASQQRVKFDITQNELVVEAPDHREISHPYADAIDPTPRVACYSVNEILAEKTRALFERQGRARDVYDVVHISRNFRDEISPARAADVLAKKFAFKKLDAQSPEQIIGAIDWDLLKANWVQLLRHQLPKLPELDGFREELPDALAWWMDPPRATPPLPNAPIPATDTLVPRRYFRRRGASLDGYLHDPIKFAARNRLLAQFTYHGACRVVEPYSLRQRRTSNVLLYAHEVSKDGLPTEQLKSYKLSEIYDPAILDAGYRPRWVVEV